ncbi:MAG: glycosyltransferase family 39 protein [Ignavibacteriae bacterium]|nr:glycosyltransferase family 39 protein [Ignavibacteriota bacterium]
MFLFLVLAIGITLRLWHIDWGLPDIYEEAYPFRTAWNFWNWGKPGFDFNPHIFNYAALSFYAQFCIQVIHYAIGRIFGVYNELQAFQQAFETDPTLFLMLARMGSLVFDIGTILVTYHFVKRIISEPVALLTASLIAINPLHIKETHLVNVDTPLTFFVMLTIYCIYHVYDNPSRKWYLLSGLCVGLAAATKYTGALLLAVLLFVHLLRSRTLAEALKSLKSPQLVYASALSGFVFILLNPYIILSFEEFQNRFSFLYYNVISYGHLGVVSSESTLGFYLFQSIPSHLGIPLTLTIIGSIVYMLWRRKKHEFIFLIFPIFYLTVIARWEYRADRYVLPIFPMLMMIGSFGLVSLWNRMVDRLKRTSSPNGIATFLQHALRTGLAMIIGIPTILSVYEYQRSHSLPDTRTVAKEWISKNIPTTSAIAMIPFGMELPERQFRQVLIPYHPVMSDALLPFYDTQWYTDLDLLICSSFDYDRYVLEPEKYGRFIQFYDTVKSEWLLVHEFKPEKNQNGPTIWLFRPPQVTKELFETTLLQGLDVLAETTLVVGFLDRLAFSLFSKGRLQKSEQLMHKALSLDSTDLRVLRELAWTLFRLGKFNDALTYVNQSLQLNPNQAEMIALKGSILLRLNNVNEAEQNLKQALALNNRLHLAYLDLELLYRSQNDSEKLIDILSKYLMILPPESEVAQRTQERIQQLRKGL